RSMTRGEQGPIANPELATPETLGAVRETELRSAGRALGVPTIECLDYPDGELESADANEVVADLAQRLKDLHPQTVITFGPEGLYWHPDHIAVHRFTMEAITALANEGCVDGLSVYHATYPNGRMKE